MTPRMNRGVVVNGRFLAKRVTGTQRYARRVSAHFADRCKLVGAEGSEKGIRGHLWEQVVLPTRVGKELLWSPCNTGPLLVRRQVLTLHDAAFLDVPECFSAAFSAWYKWLVPRLVRRVQRVITVSEFSRGRIAEIARIDAAFIEVIPNGISDGFKLANPEQIAGVRRKFDLHGRYVLTLGSLEPRKNLRGLLKAWRQISGRVPELTLAIAGGANSCVFKDADLDLESLQRVRHLGYVDDADLPAIYGAAAAFVFPSIYEGFGLPPLEAMACGTPVICSNATSLPEVVGDDAVLVDPRDSECIADGILKLLNDSALQSDLIERGMRRASRFTWKRCSEQTWAVLRREAERI